MSSKGVVFSLLFAILLLTDAEIQRDEQRIQRHVIKEQLGVRRHLACVYESNMPMVAKCFQLNINI